METPTVSYNPIDYGVMRIMDIEAGDLEIKWSRYNENECEAARQAFKKAQKKGMVFYKGTRNKYTGEVERGEVIQDFDPKAELIIGRPMVAGG